MNKSKRSVFNSITAAILNLLNGVLGFIVTYMVIKKFGSDFNGVNATANQIVTVLLLLEGGFTLATNVALIKPYQKNDYDVINGIISATKKKFEKIGIVFFTLGILVATIYSNFVVSNLEHYKIFIIIIMAILPSAFSLYYATKFRILIQAEQKEYIISLIAMCTVTIGHIINIIIMTLGCNMFMIRMTTMICAFGQSLLLGIYCKKNFKNVRFDFKPDFSKINGTKDVMIQKLTSALYKTLPIIMISVISNGGTIVASIYAIYNSIYQLVKSMLQAFMDGPRLSLGQIISEKNNDYVYKKFILYEFVTIVALSIFIGTTFIMVVPFVRWYSSGFDNGNYVNYIFAICLALISFVEIVHIPSGNYINMSGNFKKGKVIQLNSMIILIVTSIFGCIISGIYGTIFAVLATAIYLAVMEIYYVHIKVFGKISDFVRIFVVNVVCVIINCYLFSRILDFKMNFIQLFVYAIIAFCSLLVQIILLNFVFNRKYIIDIYCMLKNIFKKIR